MKILNRKLDRPKTRKDFKKVRWIYDFWGALTESKAGKEVIELAGINNGDSVADIACGTGALLMQAAPLNVDGKNVGIDLAPAMIEKARKKFSKSKINNIQFEVGDVMQLDFDDGEFDILLNNYMVDLMPETTFETVAHEFFRILKPDGIIVMTTFSFGTKRIHQFWYWIAKNFPGLLTRCRPVEFEQYLEKAGFQIETVREISQNTFPSRIIRAKSLK